MKIEWLVANVAAVGSPDKAGEQLCDIESPSIALISLLGVI